MPWSNPLHAAAFAKRRRARLWAVLACVKASPCADCGRSYPYYVMEFDHRLRDDKMFVIGNVSASRGMRVILAEIAKCDVVCANCHRRRTHERGYVDGK